MVVHATQNPYAQCPLTQMEISQVHGNLSEDAYKAQATQIMRSGPPSKASNQMLESFAQQLGLSKDAAEKVNKVCMFVCCAFLRVLQGHSRLCFLKLICPTACADRVADIRSCVFSCTQAVRTEVYGSEAIKEEGGSWSLERVQEITKEGGNVAEMADEVVLRNLYRKELEKGVTNGEFFFSFCTYILKKE